MGRYQRTVGPFSLAANQSVPSCADHPRNCLRAWPLDPIPADHCQHLFVVDLSPACIEHCKKRFANRQNISYFTNDGRSLYMIADGSLDFVFSYDSLATRTHRQWNSTFVSCKRSSVLGALDLFITRMRRRIRRSSSWPLGCRIAGFRASRGISAGALTATGVP